MKKLSFLIVFSLAVYESVAQYDFAEEAEKPFIHHQISLDGAASLIGILLKKDGNIKFNADSFSFAGSTSLPAIQLGYDYYKNKKVSFGLVGSIQSINMNVKYLVFKNANDITRRFNDIDVKLKRRYIGLKINYHFINNYTSDLYLGARFGSVFWKIEPKITDTDLDDKLTASFQGFIFPALALGYKYKIKERLGIGLEFSLGIPQFFAYGIDYRF